MVKDSTQVLIFLKGQTYNFNSKLIKGIMCKFSKKKKKGGQGRKTVSISWVNAAKFVEDKLYFSYNKDYELQAYVQNITQL